jgi:hypothetical protein
MGMEWIISKLVSAGFPADKAAEWTAALAGSAQALVALFVAIVGLYQLGAIRRQLEASVEQTKHLADQTRESAAQTRILAEQTEVMAKQRIAEEERERRWRTLNACDLYVHDTLVHQCLVNIRSATQTNGRTKGSLKKLKPDVATVLNYLDGLAIGIEQGLYLEDLIKDHMEAIVQAHVDEMLSNSYVEAVGINKVHYASLTRLSTKWSEDKKRPSFKVPVS